MFFHEVFDFSAIKCPLCVVGTGVLRFKKDYDIALFLFPVRLQHLFVSVVAHGRHVQKYFCLILV